jgi:PAS domain S-box-containing protein
MDDTHPPHQSGRRPAASGYDAESVAAACRGLEGTGLGAFFRDVPATVWMTDADLTLTFLQGPFLRELNVDPAKLLGRTLPDLLVDGRGDHPLIQRHRTALSGSEASMRIEWGGNLYYARVAPLRSPGGDVVGCAGVYQQIGSTSDVEGTLRESDIRLRRVIDSNMIGLVFGDADGQIMDANEAFLALAGYTREDLVADGVSWPALTPVESHQRLLQAIDEVRASGRCLPFELSLIRKDGRRMPVMVGGARLSATRREGVAFVLDISSHRQAQARLEAELACADALTDAGTLDDAVPALISCLCEALGWRAFGLWIVTPSGGLALAASEGLEASCHPQITRLAARIRGAGGSRWSAAGETFAAPLCASGVCYGALVLVGRVDDARDPALMTICDRTAGRVAKLLARTR